MAVTKNILPVREYQVWTSANMSEGDVLGVYESLGGRVADTITLETYGGASTVRFNVVRQVYREQGTTWSGVTDSAGRTYAGGTVLNPWCVGALRSSPIMASEFEDTGMPDVLVQNNTSQTWTLDELAVRDIRVVHASGLRITAT